MSYSEAEVIENITEETLKTLLNIEDKKIILNDIDFFIEVLKKGHEVTQYLCTAECEKAKKILMKLVNIFSLKDIKTDELYEFIKLNAACVMTRDSNWEATEIPLISNDLKTNEKIKCCFAEFKYINKWGYENGRKTYKIMYFEKNIIWISNRFRSIRFDCDPQYFILKDREIYGIKYTHKKLVVYKKTIDCFAKGTYPAPWGETKGMYPETNTLPKQPYPVRSAAGLVDCFKGITINNFDEIMTKYENTDFNIMKAEIELSEYFYKGFFYKGFLWNGNWSKEISIIKDIYFVEGLLKIEIENVTYPHTGYILYELETDTIIKAGKEN